jgi:hypothetical protein
MPQLQVLQRVDDQSAQAIRSAGDSVAESIQKKHQFEIMKQELVIKSKMANTDEEKARIDRQKLVLDSASKAFDQGIFKNPQSAQAWLRMTSNNLGPEAFDHLSAFGESVAGMQSPEADYNQARAEDLRTQNDPAKQRELMDAKLGALKGMSGGNLPPGASLAMKMGDAGTLTYPLNQNITGPEADSVSAAGNMLKVMPDINKSIDSGLFGKGSMERTLRQGLIESDNAIATSGDVKLGNFRSLYNVIRRASLFDEAGKALTGTEKSEQLRLLQLTGKTDSQIKNDLQILVDKNKNKMELILGGGNAARSGAIVERRQLKDGRILAKYSDGSIKEVGNGK